MILKISKISVLITASLFAVQFIMAQGQERPMKTTASATNIYFELGGAAVIYSFNVDSRFGKYENGLGFRLGVGGASWDGEGYVAVPVQLNYLAGNNGKYLELGAGYTYTSNLYIFNNENPHYGTLAIGFRKQPLGKKGFVFRAVFSPLIGFGSGGGFIPSAGISWGVRF